MNQCFRRIHQLVRHEAPPSCRVGEVKQELDLLRSQALGNFGTCQTMTSFRTLKGTDQCPKHELSLPMKVGKSNPVSVPPSSYLTGCLLGGPRAKTTAHGSTAVSNQASNLWGIVPWSVLYITASTWHSRKGQA